jgi:hypothetical protein
MQQGDELLPAEPADQVGAAKLLAKLGGQAAQHLVPRQMTVCVVDTLEVVDVGEQQREGLTGTQRPGDLRAGLPLPGGRVQQPGLGVGTGGGLELLVNQAALHDDDRRQGHEEQEGTQRPGRQRQAAREHREHADDDRRRQRKDWPQPLSPLPIPSWPPHKVRPAIPSSLSRHTAGDVTGPRAGRAAGPLARRAAGHLGGELTGWAARYTPGRPPGCMIGC